jgi:hypothetical protein
VEACESRVLLSIDPALLDYLAVGNNTQLTSLSPPPTFHQTIEQYPIGGVGDQVKGLAPILDNTGLDKALFQFTNSSTHDVTVQIAVYQDTQGPPNVPLAPQVLIKVYTLDVPAGSGFGSVPIASTTIDVGPCMQYDAFINQVDGSPVTFAPTFFTSNDDARRPPDGTANGFNDHDFHGTYAQWQAANPSTPLYATLLSFLQTGGSCATPTLFSGDTATIGFWAGPKGQQCINAFGLTEDGLTVGQWLTQNLPNLFSKSSISNFESSDPKFYNELLGYANGDTSQPLSASVSDAFVAKLYSDIKGTSGGPKALAQVFCAILAGFETDSMLNTTTAGAACAAKFGFNYGPGGTLLKDIDIGAAGATTLGLVDSLGNPTGMGADHAVFSILQLIEAVDGLVGKAAVQNSDNGLEALVVGINDLFSNFNQKNDIHG